MGNICAVKQNREVGNFIDSKSKVMSGKEAASSSSLIPTFRTSNSRRPKEKNAKYAYIPDNFSSLDQVTLALREAGLESSNLILGIDFTKSNEWTVTTHDQELFSFQSDNLPCHGFEEVLACYRKIVPVLRMSGPTSYGPVIEAATDIVERSGGQYHVLVIIADGQVTRSVDISDGELSSQEEKTISAIVDASSYPLSIVLVGVGDGPWEDMKNFDDKIPTREYDNFQFVNFTDITSRSGTPTEKETLFALAALMEIPLQYKATTELSILGHVTGKQRKQIPRPPPSPHTHRRPPYEVPSRLSALSLNDRNQDCPICLTNGKDLAFGCGHMTCRECGSRVSNCPICRLPISNRLRLYTG